IRLARQHPEDLEAVGTATANLWQRTGRLKALAQSQKIRRRKAFARDVPELDPRSRPCREPSRYPDQIGTFGARYHVTRLAGIEVDLLIAVRANAGDHAGRILRDGSVAHTSVLGVLRDAGRYQHGNADAKVKRHVNQCEDISSDNDQNTAKTEKNQKHTE